MILESIYEPTFSPDSHGFRPKRSCHTALKHIDINFKGAVWFVEGDIKACFDSFDHHIMVDILRARISDEYFLAFCSATGYLRISDKINKKKQRVS